MKNKLIYLLLFTLAAGGFVSCSSDLDPWADGHHRIMTKKKPGKVYTMKLSLGGDFITEYDEPMRSEDSPEGDTFVGINVFRTKIEDGATEEKFGYGVYKYENKEGSKFTKDSSIEIKLYSGYTYRFEATVLTEWTDKLYKDFTNNYSEPLKIYQDGAEISGFNNDKFPKFYESTFEENSEATAINDGRKYLGGLASGTAKVILPSKHNSINNGAFEYPRVKRFYGELNNFNPEVAENENSECIATIPMSYKCFGLKIYVENLPEGTYMSVEDIKLQSDGSQDSRKPHGYLVIPEDLQLTKENYGIDNAWSSLYSMNDLKGDSEDFNLVFTWHKGSSAADDVTFDPVHLTIKEKTQKVIKINIEGAGTTEHSGNIKFNLADDLLTKDENEVEVTNKTDK